MAWKMNYRYEIRDKGAAGADGAVRLAINAGYTSQLTYTAALQSMTSFVRRFQSIGGDCVGVMLGQPRGADAAGTLAPLEAAYQDEEIYARVDTPDKALTLRISRANTLPDNALELPNDPDEEVDQLVA